MTLAFPLLAVLAAAYAACASSRVVVPVVRHTIEIAGPMVITGNAGPPCSLEIEAIAERESWVFVALRGGCAVVRREVTAPYPSVTTNPDRF